MEQQYANLTEPALSEEVLEMPVAKAPRSSGSLFKSSRTYARGFKKSQERLMELRYDPIKELVNLYHKIQAEEKFWRAIRTGEIIQLLPSGKQRPYNAQAHAATIEQLHSIATDLLRYGYGRVPETMHIDTGPQPLVINLTKEGDVYEINGKDDE
jgi:hypothetical protein